MGILLYLILIVFVGALLWWLFRALQDPSGVTEASEPLDRNLNPDGIKDLPNAPPHQLVDAALLRAVEIPASDSSALTEDEPHQISDNRWRQGSDAGLERDATLATSAPDVFAGDEAMAETYLGAEPDAVQESLLPVPESMDTASDQIVVARLGSPQLLQARMREVLDRLADDTESDFDDPRIRPLEGGGAAMALPVGAGVESALFMLDLLGNPDDGPGIDAEAWLTVRADDLFLFVTEQRASAVLNTAAEEVESQFPQDDPGFAAAFASAIHARLAPFGPALGTRLYAYIWAGGLDSVPRLLATSDQDESFEISWEDLDEPRLRPLERTYRPYVDVPLDVREGLGI